LKRKTKIKEYISRKAKRQSQKAQSQEKNADFPTEKPENCPLGVSLLLLSNCLCCNWRSERKTEREKERSYQRALIRIRRFVANKFQLAEVRSRTALSGKKRTSNKQVSPINQVEIAASSSSMVTPHLLSPSDALKHLT